MISATCCAECPSFQSRNDGSAKGWCSAFGHSAHERHQATTDCHQQHESLKVQLFNNSFDVEGITEQEIVVEVSALFGDVVGAIAKAGYSLNEWQIADHWHPVEVDEF